MDHEEWQEAMDLDISPAMCYYKGDDTGGRFCGAMSTNFLKMPAGIPSMPMCPKHFEEFDNWTYEDSKAIVFDLIMEKMMEEEEEYDS
jgi:hypothetical protein